MSTIDFKNFFYEHLSLSSDRFISLHFFNDSYASNKINYLLSGKLTLHEFLGLRSLTIHSTDPNQIDQILIECLRLPLLTHLKLIQCQMFPQTLISIWTLPKLTHCHLELNEWNSHINLQTTSTSIKHLHIEIFSSDFDLDLQNLLNHTPRLRYIHVPVYRSITLEQNQHLTTVKLTFHNEYEQISDIFQNMSQLTCLSIDIGKNFCYKASIWEQMITTYLPNLKILRLLIQNQLLGNRNKEQQIDEILDSFSSSFWIDKHQWFIQCHWTPDEEMYLYTLPYVFSYFHVENMHTKSTCPHPNQYYSFKSVHTLYYEYSVSCNIILPNFYFTNIENLTIKFPVDLQIFSIIPTFVKLTALTISVINEYDSSQLQAIFNQTPYLYSIRFDQWLSTRQIPLSNNTHSSLRKIDLRITEYNNRIWYLNSSEYSTFINSSIGHQCEILFINVEKLADIVQLIDSMPNLLKLTAGFRNHTDEKLKWPSINKFIIWLERRFPHIYQITHSQNILIIEKEGYLN